jgi:hypothetical protein
MELTGVQAALDEAAVLLDRARSAGIPVIHIQHDGGEGSPYDVRAQIGAIVGRVAPRPSPAPPARPRPSSTAASRTTGSTPPDTSGRSPR